MASDIIQNWAFKTKNSSGHDFDSHTHAYTPYTSKNSSDFGHNKIQIQFQKYIFSDIVYNVENWINFANIGRSGPPGPFPGSATGD